MAQCYQPEGNLVCQAIVLISMPSFICGIVSYIPFYSPKICGFLNYIALTIHVKIMCIRCCLFVFENFIDCSHYPC